MKRIVCLALMLTSIIVCAALGQQQKSSPAPGVIVPRLIRFGGALRTVGSEALSRTVGVTFALYREQEGGAPLWLETQNVPIEASGRYNVLLGASKPEGVPMELFTSGEARWLGVQAEGQREQPRVLLVSVPYALKAGDADTVGGRPASSFVLAQPENPRPSAASVSSVSAITPGALSGTGTTNFIPRWKDNVGTLDNSIIFQSTGLNIGIGNAAPVAKLDVQGGAFIRGRIQLPSIGTATTATGFNSNPLDLTASAFKSGTGAAAVNETFRWQARPVRNNTSSPSGRLSLLFGSGTATPTDTGLSISSRSALGFLTTDPPADLLAVRRTSSIDFYVNGALKASITTNLPTTAYSIYELRLVNGNTQMGGQAFAVSFLTVGIPMS